MVYRHRDIKKKYMEVHNMHPITLRILMICAGNHDMTNLFLTLLYRTDFRTLENIINVVEKEKWTASKVCELFKESNQNIDLFITRFT